MNCVSRNQSGGITIRLEVGAGRVAAAAGGLAGSSAEQAWIAPKRALLTHFSPAYQAASSVTYLPQGGAKCAVFAVAFRQRFFIEYAPFGCNVLLHSTIAAYWLALGKQIRRVAHAAKTSPHDTKTPLDADCISINFLGVSSVL